MTKEKIRTVTCRSYLYLSCFRRSLFKGHPKYDEFIIVTLTNNGGNIEFVLTNASAQDVNKLDNPPSGTYIFPLIKGVKNYLVIHAKCAKGSYTIQRKTIIEK